VSRPAAQLAALVVIKSIAQGANDANSMGRIADLASAALGPNPPMPIEPLMEPPAGIHLRPGANDPEF
jgi:hypothetical protein